MSHVRWARLRRGEALRDGRIGRARRSQFTVQVALRAYTPQSVVTYVDVLRRERMTGKVIAAEVGVSTVTVSRILKQLGLNSSKTLGPGEAIRRYEREHSGALTHIDVRKLDKFNRVGHRITSDPYRPEHEARHQLGVRPCLCRRYTWHRPHTGTGDKPTISRLELSGNDLLRLHTRTMLLGL